MASRLLIFATTCYHPQHSLLCLCQSYSLHSAKLILFCGFMRLAVHYFFGDDAILGHLVVAVY